MGTYVTLRTVEPYATFSFSNVFQDFFSEIVNFEISMYQRRVFMLCSMSAVSIRLVSNTSCDVGCLHISNMDSGLHKLMPANR